MERKNESIEVQPTRFPFITLAVNKYVDVGRFAEAE